MTMSFDLVILFLVRKARLELAQENSHYPLKVARLPFRHFRVLGMQIYDAFLHFQNFS